MGHAAMRGALGPYPLDPRSLGHRVAARFVRARAADDPRGRLGADASRQSRPRRRHARRPPRRRPDLSRGHAHGHGDAPLRQRQCAAVPGDAQPRPADGQEGLSLAARQRRDRRRRNPPDRPPASARSVHGIVGELFGQARREEQRLPLRRPARRARVRPARLHAPPVDQRLARSADHPPLARFDPHHLWRGDRRAWCSTASSSKPRASTAASPTSSATISRPAPLDSTALRLSWNPTRNLSLQGSWAHLEEPEQLEPGVDQRRWSASGIYTRPTANGWWSSTLAWGRKTIDGEAQDAFALESSLKRGALDPVRPRRDDRE